MSKLMTEPQHLARAFERHFTNPDAAAFAHFVTVTDGLTCAQAAAVPAPRFNSVWRVVNHTMFWMDGLRLALMGAAADPHDYGMKDPGDGGWMPQPALTDANWTADRLRALDVCRATARVIEAIPQDQMEKPLEHWWNLTTDSAILSIFSHNSYHTAEIIGIRHMLGLWVDHPFV